MMSGIRRLLLSVTIGLALVGVVILAAGTQTRAYAAAVTRYVAPGGACGGASPCYANVQSAVNAAVAGDEIRVSAGTYTGVTSQGGLSQAVYISKSITLRGGFTTSDWTSPDPEANPTVLDAQVLGRVVTVIGPANVTFEGLRFTNGRSTNMGGLYMGQYSCTTLSGRGGGGGLCVQNATVALDRVWILTNTASTTGGMGGGAFASNAVLTLTNSVVQGNQAGTGSNRSYGGGLFLSSGQATIEQNTIVDNIADPVYDGDGGGVYVRNAYALLRGNDIRGNEVRGDASSAARMGGAGVAIEGAGATLTGNRIVDNDAHTYIGGGVSWKGGMVTITANLIVSNTARWGGGLYAGNAPALVVNNVISGNTTDGHGSAICVETYNPNTPSFRHNTMAGNTGGDGVAIYVRDNGRAAFINTILADHEVGVGGGWSTSINFERTLWDNNITNTTTLIGDVGHLTGTAAFAADGYHLTEASAAMDAGIDAGVTSDIDGDPRPRGTAPDIGADESPYGQSAGTEGITFEKSALPPRLLLTPRTIGGAPVYLIQQEYLLRLVNGLTETAMTSFSVVDNLPAELDFAAQVHYPPMTFQTSGNTLTWDSLTPLASNSQAWISVVGNAGAEDGGKTLTNTASVDYVLSGGETGATTADVSQYISNFPPFIAWPENGEFCLSLAGKVELRGLAKPGATLYVYEDGVYQTQAIASSTGEFEAGYVPTEWGAGSPVVLTVRDCTGGTCGDISNTVTVRGSDSGWDPQRSVWEKKMGENWFRWPFRNASGEMATINWEMPGAYGFHDTALKLYECSTLPDAGYAVDDVIVDADGILYQDPDGPDAGGYWQFAVHANHTVNFSVVTKNTPGATKVYHSNGWILIDPDGFVFDVTKGLDVISSTVTGVPTEVGNTIAGVTVTAMVSMPTWGGWVPWPAYLYNDQVNPQVTGDDGYFAFFTPPGSYYLQVEGVDGYQSWRSPVVQVITEIVHVNVPLTPWSSGQISQITAAPEGLSRSTVTVPAGGTVEWRSALDAGVTAGTLATHLADPPLQILSQRDPLLDVLGWDSGRLPPGQVYRRQFIQPGVYPYADSAGHTGTVVVTAHVYLPLVLH